MRLTILIAATCLSWLAAAPARAEVGEVVLAKQFGLPYLPFMVMEDRGLVEKHAKALGLPDLKVRHTSIAGTGGMMDALLSGSAHVGAGGIHAMLILWDKTKGDVKGLGGLSAYDDLLVCSDPAVKSLKDLSEKNRIALPAPKVSPQAIYLQIGAAKLWGQDSFGRLDSLTIARSHPDALAALLSRTGEINCYFSSPPYQERAMREPGIHKVTSAYEMLGVSKITHAVAFMSSKFLSDNPKAGAALLAAFKESYDIMRADLLATAQTYLRLSREKESAEWIHAILSNKNYDVTDVPYAIMKNAEFLHRIGTIKSSPKALSEVFLPGARIEGGN